MPDIQLRFNKDMLVISAPIDTALERQGVDVDADREFLNLIEPEAIHEAFRLEHIAGAQCLATATAGITRARLAHVRLEDRAPQIASAALDIVRKLKPQHVLATIGPTGLPLDATSKASLKQNRDEYVQAVRDFGTEGIDAFLFQDFDNKHDMQCALMGARMVSDLPIIACVNVDGDAKMHGGRQDMTEALLMMQEYGADVVGFQTMADVDTAASLADQASKVCQVPLAAFLSVGTVNERQLAPTPQNPYYCADTMIQAADLLRSAGVQFLRATGKATPAYTGALVAVTAGTDVVAGKVGE